MTQAENQIRRMDLDLAADLSTRLQSIEVERPVGGDHETIQSYSGWR